MSEESSEWEQATGRYLHRFKVRKTREEMNLSSGFPWHLKKGQQKRKISPQEEASFEEVESEKGSACKSRTGPCPHKCKMQVTLVEVQHRNDYLRQKVKMLQEKVKGKDKEIKKLKRLLRSSEGIKEIESDEDSSDSSSFCSETIEVIYAM